MSASRRSRGIQAHAAAASAGRNLQYGGRGGFAALRPGVLALAKLVMLPIASAAPLGLWQAGVRMAEEDAPKSPDDPNLWAYLGVAVALVLLGGAFAGLTIALMGQDETYLQVIATSGEGSERKHAQKVLNLLKKGKHWVLVTLLLSNVITNETLPIVLDRSLGGGWPAVLSSTILIVIFGEVAPQSVCVRYGLAIGAFMAPAVLVLMWIMSPVAWPTAKLLDWLLGEDHGTTYKKAGLKTLVQLHKTLGTTPGERLLEDEVNIIQSVLDLKEKSVSDVMTPMQDVFTMSADTVLDERMMDTILSQGYSRIPIYAPGNSRNFIGMLLVKILITYDPEDAQRVRDFALATLPETSPETSCLDIINFFQEGKSHMVLVSDFPGTDKGALGVVTLEDVIEELIGEEIVDESDVFVDIHKAIRRLAPAEQRRYRLGKSGNLVEIDETVQSESEREGKADDENAPLLGKTESRKSSIAGNGPNGQAPSTTFMMRRKSSNASETPREVAKPKAMRSNTTDLREHLKHLGPSNVASKPKPTKYTSVKIKPGVSTIPEGQATSTGALAPLQRSRSEDARPSASEDRENTPLLSNAAADASNGVAALQAGYGTNDAPTGRQRGQSEGAEMTPKQASKVAEENTTSPPAAQPDDEPDSREDDDDFLIVPPKLVIGSNGEEDTVGEMEAPSRDPSKPRRSTRSGSITETTVDVGGVKKTVLDTNSSSSEEAESPTKGPSSSQGDLLDGDADGNGKGAAEANGDGQQGQGQKPKKKKKPKKRH
ncbi:hypothetical protein LTR36_006465 [Oleoguttula mirabilis]|uniref:DUF21-domain-containing protein n=1 Tax=Oleoguttula mirabilis TaxID=1507867 RepID=A0AAV9JV45_9PEZI|nr:hypothetical protein LTR36_006465 [Oleoguttula mirabilis]